MRSDRVSIILALGIILTVLMSINAAWASPEQSPNRQTVPTKTPKESTPVPPSKEKDTPTPVPQTITATPTQVPVTPLASVTPGPVLTQTLSATMTATPAGSPQTLPRAGASLPLVVGLSSVILGSMVLATGMILARTNE